MLNLFFKNKKLKPVVETQRYKCPFYGFAMGMGFLADQNGNQCPLLTDRYSPCHMEIRGQLPEWRKCYLNVVTNKKPIEKMINSLQIFPSEFMPKGKSSWEGIKFKDWYNYIMK